jgi:hypothetical protein
VETTTLFLNNIIEIHSSQEVRLSAAKASVELLWVVNPQYDDLSPHVAKLLTESFLTIQHLSEDVTNIFYQSQSLLYDLSRLEPEHLFRLLEHPALTDIQLHLVGRSLLYRAFQMHSDVYIHWSYMPLHYQSGLYYQVTGRPTPLRTLTPLQQRVCQTILLVDRIWRMPTNMFSFFFGLPDTQHQLRKFVEQAKKSS